MAMPAEKDDDNTAHSFAKGQLKAIIERIEKLEEEKKAISDDIKDVYGEAKGNGFDVKALRAWVRERGVGTLEIKKRGIDLDPAALRRTLKPKGKASATLMVTPTPAGARVLVCSRVDPV